MWLTDSFTTLTEIIGHFFASLSVPVTDNSSSVHSLDDSSEALFAPTEQLAQAEQPHPVEELLAEAMGQDIRATAGQSLRSPSNTGVRLARGGVATVIPGGPTMRVIENYDERSHLHLHCTTSTH